MIDNLYCHVICSFRIMTYPWIQELVAISVRSLFNQNLAEGNLIYQMTEWSMKWIRIPDMEPRLYSLPDWIAAWSDEVNSLNLCLYMFLRLIVNRLLKDEDTRSSVQPIIFKIFLRFLNGGVLCGIACTAEIVNGKCLNRHGTSATNQNHHSKTLRYLMQMLIALLSWYPYFKVMICPCCSAKLPRNKSKIGSI